MVRLVIRLVNLTRITPSLGFAQVSCTTFVYTLQKPSITFNQQLDSFRRICSEVDHSCSGSTVCIALECALWCAQCSVQCALCSITSVAVA